MLPENIAAVQPSNSAEFRSYEELDGAEGREVFFRPHRFSAADLAPLCGTATVSLGGSERECPIRDVSQNGVAFSLSHTSVHQSQMLRLTLRFDGYQLWRGDARVSSVREQPDGTTVVGASFNGALLDTDELLHLRDVRRWQPDVALCVGQKPWHATGNHCFKALVADLRLHLEDAEEKLGEFERSLPWHLMQEGSAGHAALVSRLRAEFGADVIRFSAQIDQAMRGADPVEAASLKKFSIRHVHRFLVQSPWIHRARYKPFGYPGDYEVMNFMYEKDFEGPTLFARAVGHAFIHTPAGLAVRYRKDLMVRQLREVLQRHTGTARPVRFLSIASGPARELQELLNGIEELPAPLEIVLFDQDKGALAHAYRRLHPLAEARFPGRVRILFLNESIKRLL
ncbi:MAG TPA: PilZ domain-containing protein, partial [Anaeromyxobacteraceae bacterium]|nr:PilZ domain-containing protein [Anaeromyxobacteraceae bacterium]